MITLEVLQEKIEAEITNHLLGVEEIFSLKACDKISEGRNLNVVGIINALATKVVTASDDFEILSDDKREELSNEIVKFIEAFSSKIEKHPIDSIFYSIKMLSDVLIQMSIIDQIEKENLEDK